MARTFYSGVELEEKYPQKIIKYFRIWKIDPKDIICVWCPAIWWSPANAVVCTEEAIIYAKVKIAGQISKYYFNDITSASIEKKGVSRYVTIIIGGGEKVWLEVMGDCEPFCDFVRSKMGKNNQSQAHTFSSADEIVKFKQLMDEGVITQEQFERKKNELLGI